MRPKGVVLPAPSIGLALGLGHGGEQLGVQDSSLNRLLNDSAKPFCHGDTCSMYALVDSFFSLQRRIAWAMNSGAADEGR